MAKKIKDYITPVDNIPVKKMSRFITADIETFVYEGTQYPYSIGYYINHKDLYKSFFLVDYIQKNESVEKIIEKSNHLIVSFLNDLNKQNTEKLPIYFHNFARFDGIFILKRLIQVVVSEIKNDKNIKFPQILYKDNELLQIKYKNLIFVDSLKILPQALRKLENFFVPNSDLRKGTFEFSKLTIHNLDEFKNDIAKYMQIDIILLYNIIKNAQKYFNDLFPFLDITKSISLSSISLKIFRAKYLKEKQIYKLKNNPDNYIRKAYFGGGVDVYKPRGNNLYYYDVNSLYPFMMKNYMPVGRPRFKVYNNKILDTNEIDFGYFSVLVEYYGNLNIPLLPYKNDGKTIFPKGKWKGVYFSEELKKAVSLGYKITLRNGYIFDKCKIFEDFVTDLYNIRISNTDVTNKLIMKLILNSTYGRFGMKKIMQRCQIVNSKECISIEEMYDILNVEKIHDDLYLISYKNIMSEDIYIQKKNKSSNTNYQKIRKMYDIQQDSINTAVHIAAATTSYARIYMHDFKNLKNNPCYYSDTDSVFLKERLSDNYISSTKLGSLKLEQEKIDCIFLAPKIYIYKTRNNENIIKFKGVNKQNLTPLNWDSFLDFYTNDRTYKYERESLFLRTVVPPKVYSKNYLMTSSFTFQKRKKFIIIKINGLIQNLFS